MCRHFELGLRDEIQVRLSSTMFRDFYKLVDAPLKVEFSSSRSRCPDRLKWVIPVRVHLRGLLRDQHQVVVDLAVLVPRNTVRVLYNDSRGLIADFLGLLVISQFRGVIHNVRDVTNIKRASAMLVALQSSIWFTFISKINMNSTSGLDSNIFHFWLDP